MLLSELFRSEEFEICRKVADAVPRSPVSLHSADAHNFCPLCQNGKVDVDTGAIETPRVSCQCPQTLILDSQLLLSLSQSATPSDLPRLPQSSWF